MYQPLGQKSFTIYQFTFLMKCKFLSIEHPYDLTAAHLSIYWFYFFQQIIYCPPHFDGRENINREDTHQLCLWHPYITCLVFSHTLNYNHTYLIITRISHWFFSLCNYGKCFSFHLVYIFLTFSFFPENLPILKVSVHMLLL